MSAPTTTLDALRAAVKRATDDAYMADHGVSRRHPLDGVLYEMATASRDRARAALAEAKAALAAAEATHGL